MIQEDEVEIQGTKRKLRRIKVLDVESTRHALFLAHRAFTNGFSTLQNLREQGDRLLNTQDNLAIATSVDKDTARKLKELKQANQNISMTNSFPATNSKYEGDVHMLDARYSDRKKRDVARAANWHTWTASCIYAFASVPLRCGATSQNVLARTAYQFEDDSEDERTEDVINGNLDELPVAVQGLRSLAVVSEAQLSVRENVLDRTGRLAVNIKHRLVSTQSKLDCLR